MPFALPRFVRSLLTSTTPPVDAILAGPCSTVPVSVVPLTDRDGGPRVVTSPASGLIVGIAPVHETAMLAALPHFAAGGGYTGLNHGTLDVPGLDLRPGDTLDLPRRMNEHLLAPPCPVEHVLMVGAADPVFAPLGRDETIALQWLLYRLAERAGRAALHGAAPARPALLDHEPQRLVRWSADLRPMLCAAGTHAFVPPGRVIGPAIVDPTDGEAAFRAVPRGYLTELPPGLTERDGAEHYELAWRRVSARATVVGHWTVVHAGATVDPDEHSGVQGCIAAKRRHMLMHGVLQRGADGLLRLTRDTALPSLVNALRVVTGTNELAERWRPAS